MLETAQAIRIFALGTLFGFLLVLLMAILVTKSLDLDEDDDDDDEDGGDEEPLRKKVRL